MKIALTIPGPGGNPVVIDSGVPVPTGGITGPDSMGVTVIKAFLNFFVIGAILFSLYQFLTGGISIIMSKGDKERYRKGRDKIFHAIIGLILTVISIMLVSILAYVAGIKDIMFFILPQS
jgi:hypothetical protein